MVPESCKRLSPIEEFNQLIRNKKVVALIEGTVECPILMANQDFVNILTRNGVMFIAVDVS